MTCFCKLLTAFLNDPSLENAGIVVEDVSMLNGRRFSLVGRMCREGGTKDKKGVPIKLYNFSIQCHSIQSDSSARTMHNGFDNIFFSLISCSILPKFFGIVRCPTLPHLHDISKGFAASITRHREPVAGPST
jgi:hypothetical protein